MNDEQQNSFCVYSIAGRKIQDIRLLLNIRDAEDASDFCLYRSAILKLQGSRFILDVVLDEWITSLCDGEDGEFYAVSVDGALFTYRLGRWTDAQLGDGFSLNEIREIPPRTLLTCGDNGLFARIHNDVAEAMSVKYTDDFIGFAGNSMRSVVIIAPEGKIFLSDGRQVVAADSPTTSTPASIAVTKDGMFYICGEAGLLIKGSGECWEMMDGADADMLSVAVWGGNPFFAASDEGVLVIENGELRVFKSNFFADSVFSAGGILFCCSGTEIMAYDGSGWSTLEVDLSFAMKY